MKTYGTYRFKNKDPIIDVVRTCIEIYAALRELKVPKAIEEISKVSNVAETTIHGWLSGDTISPRFCTVAAVDAATWGKLGDRNLREGSVMNSTGQQVEAKIVRHFDPIRRDEKLAMYRSEAKTIDAQLEVVNAITDLME